MKFCTKCRLEKPLNEFAFEARNTGTGRTSSCRKCISVNTRAWYQTKKNDLKYKNNRKDRCLKYSFGISLEQYNKKLEKQNSVCAICEKPELARNKSLSTDHNHDTKQIRDLLCSKCNKALGQVNESPLILQKMIDYLHRWNSVSI